MLEKSVKKRESVILDAETVDYLEGLATTELVQMVNDFRVELKRMKMENQVFQNFLEGNEPSLIAAMERTMSAVLEMQDHIRSAMNIKANSQLSDLKITATTITQSDDQSTDVSISHASFLSKRLGHSKDGRGPRINLSQKTDLVMREIEETQIRLTKFMERAHRTKCRLRAEIEETGIRDTEVKDAIHDFEQTIVIEAVEKLTQKIPAEKFVRYMQEWLKTAQFMLEKLRLRTSSLRIQRRKLKNLLSQKEELGECVHEVDFEKLSIENKNFLLRIEQKNSHLLELKRMNGKANLMMTTHKNFLQKQEAYLTEIKNNIKNTNDDITDLQKVLTLTDLELLNDQMKRDRIKHLMKIYQVPEVMDYVLKKSELNDLKKTLKVWMRKRNIQNIALDTYTKMMTNITGIHKPRTSWYDFDRKKEDDGDISEAFTSKPSASDVIGDDLMERFGPSKSLVN